MADSSRPTRDEALEERDYWRGLSDQHARERDVLAATLKREHRRASFDDEAMWGSAKRELRRRLRAAYRPEPVEEIPGVVVPVAESRSWLDRLLGRGGAADVGER